jgi:transcriptional regulator of PTS gene
MLEAHLVQETEIRAGSRGRSAVGLMVETEAWHYLSPRISRGEIHLALRDLSSKLVVEEQLELALQHEQPFATRLLDHIDQFFIRHQKKLERSDRHRHHAGIIDTENGIIHRMPFYEDVKRCRAAKSGQPYRRAGLYSARYQRLDHGGIAVWRLRGARDVIQVVIDHNVGAG